MCGIVAAAARREVSEILLEGLRRLEYRGYDSAGMALVDNERNLQLHKQQGKVSELERAQALNPILGCTGSPTPAGRHTANPRWPMLTPTFPVSALPWCTTASLKTTQELREELRALVMRFPRSPTRKWLFTCCTSNWRAVARCWQAMQNTVARLGWRLCAGRHRR